MRITLFIFSLICFAATIVLAVYVEPKAGNSSGGGFSLPFWPFVLLLAVFVLLLSILFPNIAELIRLWMRTKVEIAKAENPDPTPDAVPAPQALPAQQVPNEPKQSGP
jgi:hypothetical protein